MKASEPNSKYSFVEGDSRAVKTDDASDVLKRVKLFTEEVFAATNAAEVEFLKTLKENDESHEARLAAAVEQHQLAQQEVEKLKLELESKASEISGKDLEVERGNAQIAALERILAQLGSDLRFKEDLSIKLEEEFNRAQELARETQEKLQAELVAKNDELEHARKTNEELHPQIAARSEELERTRLALIESKDENSKLTSLLTETRSAHARDVLALQEKIETFGADAQENEQLKLKVTALEREIAAKDAQIQSDLHEKAALDSTISGLRRDLSLVREQLDVAIHERTSLREQLESSVAELANLRDQISIQEELILNERKVSFEGQQILESEKSALADQLEAERASHDLDVASLKQELAAATSQIESYALELGTLSQANSDLKRDLLNSNASLDQAVQNLSEAQKSCELLNSESAVLRRDIAAQIDQLNEERQLRAKNEQEFAVQKARFLTDLEESRLNHDREVSELKSKSKSQSKISTPKI